MTRSLHTSRRQMLAKLESPVRFIGPVAHRPLGIRDQAAIRRRILSEPCPRMNLLRRFLRLFSL